MKNVELRLAMYMAACAAEGISEAEAHEAITRDARQAQREAHDTREQRRRALKQHHQGTKERQRRLKQLQAVHNSVDSGDNS